MRGVRCRRACADEHLAAGFAVLRWRIE